MRWINVNSVKELKELGRFRDVTREIKEDLGDTFKIKGKAWNEVYNNIAEFREIIQNINKEINFEDGNKEEIENYNNPYFSSLANEYIYYLLELDGELRNKNLGIINNHFKNKKKAKEWKDKILKVIHPEVSRHPNSSEAIAELNSIYNKLLERT
ncbi:MAG: hypothetical protein ACRC3Y_04780 [Romboutsia sp.]|uniref:hypothetical protein n=1 Tax=Romboutsia sp. TaxID=1965302 RepID=UPI003F2CEB7B